MLTKDVMSPDPVTADEATTVRDAIELLFTLEVRHLPITSEGRLVGILSDRDIREHTVPISWKRSVIVEPEQSEDNPLDRPVTTVMSGGTFTAGPDATLATLVDILCDNRVGSVVVVDDEDAVVGIVSYIDVLRALRP